MSNGIIEKVYSSSGDILDILEYNGYLWVDKHIKEKFQMHYAGMELDFLEQVNLLMFEVLHRYKNSDQYLYDICNALICYANTNYSKLYLLNKLSAYSTKPIYIIELYKRIEKDARISADYRLLAESIRKIGITHHHRIDPLEFEMHERELSLLKKAESLAKTADDWLSLACSYYLRGSDMKAENLGEAGFALVLQMQDEARVVELFSKIIDRFEFEHGINTFPDALGDRFRVVLQDLHILLQ